MSQPVAGVALRVPALRDLVALTKPGILVFSVMTAAGAMSLAPGVPDPARWLPLLLGTGLLVGSANALNMYLERELDCLMARTKNRPLPAGRMDPPIALGFGILLALLALPLLALAVNPLTGGLGLLALVSYVGVYTPLKQRTTAATLVGSLPGALPALMGWTAATGAIEPGGLAVFGLLFIWQIPHFHAIALFRRKDYHRAGLKILPVEGGERTTRHAILFYLALQVQVSLLLYPLGVAGTGYLAAAALLGGGYFLYAALGLKQGDARWARNLFRISLIYLPLIFAAMVLDGLR
jgi:protoheme IX farnesyltransferase